MVRKFFQDHKLGQKEGQENGEWSEEKAGPFFFSSLSLIKLYWTWRDWEKTDFLSPVFLSPVCISSFIATLPVSLA